MGIHLVYLQKPTSTLHLNNIMLIVLHTIVFGILKS